MDIIVVGTHEYTWALRIFARQFNAMWDKVPVTHWGDVSVGGLPDNFQSKHVPCYEPGSWKWDNWFGNGLSSVLETIVEPLVLMFLPDHWLCAPVDKRGVRSLAEYMMGCPDVVRGNLTANTCLDAYGVSVQVRDEYEIVQVHPNSPHCSILGGCAGYPALWNRKNLLEILEPNWNLWDLERLGTQKMAREWPRWRSVGILRAPLQRAHGLYHDKPKVASFEGMSEKDVVECAKMLPGGWAWTR